MKKFAAISLAITLITLTTSPAVAGVASKVTRLKTISTVSWSAQLATPTGQPSSSQFVINWKLGPSEANDYFRIQNTGTITLSALSLSITRNGTLSEVFFDLCQGGSWALDTCSGTIIRIGKASDNSISLANLSFLAGNSLSIKASTTKSGWNKFTTSLSVTVSRSSIRNATELNS